jgi:hypothetical protein
MKLLLVSLVFVVSGCGALEKTSGCDFRPKKPRCQERTVALTSQTVWEATCKAIPDSIYQDSGCPRDGIVGGCDVSEPANPIIDWYYAPKTVAEVMTECAGKPFKTP